jgi:probable F420-dependent oxidoreductase
VPARPAPQLSMSLITFSAEDPGTWQPLFDRAKAADAAGIDRLVVSDHVVFGENLEAYAKPESGGSEGGKQPTGPDGHWLEPLTVLSMIGAMTSHVRLGTNILLAALRRPAVLAKTLATMDVLTGGRIDLGVGVGWQREEYEAAGLRFEGRGKLLDHSLEVCQTLWREQRAQYDSELLQFDNIHMMPKPAQAGGVPLWISGTVNDLVARRLARFGSGWIPWGPASRDIVTGAKQMGEALAAHGRDIADLQIVGSVAVVRDSAGAPDFPRSMEALPPLVEAGVTDFRIHLPASSDAGADAAQLVDAVAAFRAVVGRS